MTSGAAAVGAAVGAPEAPVTAPGADEIAVAALAAVPAVAAGDDDRVVATASVDGAGQSSVQDDPVVAFGSFERHPGWDTSAASDVVSGTVEGPGAAGRRGVGGLDPDEAERDGEHGGTGQRPPVLVRPAGSRDLAAGGGRARRLGGHGPTWTVTHRRNSLSTVIMTRPNSRRV